VQIKRRSNTCVCLPLYAVLQIKTASWLSGVSTASMGKFDKKLAGEKEGERKLPGELTLLLGTLWSDAALHVAAILCVVCSGSTGCDKALLCTVQLDSNWKLTCRSMQAADS
jgi:hypothetical protein